MSVVTALTCTVEVVGRPRESKIKPGTVYQPVLFIIEGQDPEASENRLWKSLSVEEATGLTKGSRVQLVPRDNSGQHHQIVVLGEANSHWSETRVTAPVSTPRPVLSDDQKREIASYVTQMADLFKFCYGEALKRLPDASAGDVRTVATTLYLSAAKRFGL